MQILLARSLAPEGFGLFTIGWSILRIFSIFGHLGLDSGVLRFGGEYWQKDTKKFGNVIRINILGAFASGVFFGVALFLIAPWLAIEVFRKSDLINIFRGFSIIFPLITTIRVIVSASSLAGKMFCGSFAEDMFPPIIQLTTFFFLLQTKVEILQAAILSVGISYILGIIISILCLAKAFPQVSFIGTINLKDLFTIFKYSIPAITGVTLGAFNLWGDRLLVGYFSTEKTTGIYQSISLITMFTTIIISGIKITIAPTISKLHHAGNFEEISKLGRSTIRWILLISMPILVYVVINAREVIILLFGEDYLLGTTPLIILTIGQVFYLMCSISDQLLLMTGRQSEWLKISATIFVLTVFCSAILIPRFDIIGASIISSAMMLLLSYFSIYRIKKSLGFWLINKHSIKLFIVSFSTWLFTYVLTSHLILNIIEKMVLISFIVPLIFLSFAYLFGLEESERILIRNFFKKYRLKL